VEFVKFKELEEKITKIIEEKAVLKTRSQELEELLKNKDRELEEANNKLKGLNEERETVRTKVDSLLDLLQDI
jgi:chromosome segregation ATPase